MGKNVSSQPLTGNISWSNNGEDAGGYGRQHAITAEEVYRQIRKKANMLSCPVACINMATVRAARILTVGMAMAVRCRWSVALAVLLGCAGASRAATLSSSSDPDTTTTTPAGDHDDYLLKQVVWKRCYRKISPACLKLNLVRTVELMTKDSSLSLVPGVFFTSNSSELNVLPPDIARSLSSEHAPLDDLVAFTVGKYLRSLTLNVNIVDFVSGGNETLQKSVIDAFSGRARKNGLMGGYGAIAAMMGGMMASMMMAALAALAGKAMMTSLLALMMAAFAAMKGGGGGGGSKTYEVITKPVVSHIDTHSSEVQHEHHGHYHKRSLELGEAERKQTTVNGGPEGLEDNGSNQRGRRNTEDGVYVNYHPYPWKRNLELNGENRGRNNYPVDETSHHRRRSVDANVRLDQKENTSKNLDSSKWSKVPESSDGPKTPLLGHPRQNHKEYKRHSDDDLLMTFGLFR